MKDDYFAHLHLDLDTFVHMAPPFSRLQHLLFARVFADLDLTRTLPGSR